MGAEESQQQREVKHVNKHVNKTRYNDTYLGRHQETKKNFPNVETLSTDH
jgi:hypothetical protein